VKQIIHTPTPSTQLEPHLINRIDNAKKIFYGCFFNLGVPVDRVRSAILTIVISEHLPELLFDVGLNHGKVKEIATGTLRTTRIL
jgi:hypothetical protein